MTISPSIARTLDTSPHLSDGRRKTPPISHATRCYPCDRDRERHVEGEAEGRERGREGREQSGDDEDQPDVVRFPDRADRIRDEGPLALAHRSDRQEIPHPAAEVRSPEQPIQGETP